MSLFNYGYGERKEKKKKSEPDMGSVIFFVLIVMLLFSAPFKLTRVFLIPLIAIGIVVGLVYGVNWILS